MGQHMGNQNYGLLASLPMPGLIGKSLTTDDLHPHHVIQSNNGGCVITWKG
ncbi:hypothetical protein [Moorena producens]|uniref:hypothetical protein n=1 Tax=Moorena producens TaxID=1155739 RepID=UPI003C789BD7